MCLSLRWRCVSFVGKFFDDISSCFSSLSTHIATRHLFINEISSRSPFSINFTPVLKVFYGNRLNNFPRNFIFCAYPRQSSTIATMWEYSEKLNEAKIRDGRIVLKWNITDSVIPFPMLSGLFLFKKPSVEKVNEIIFEIVRKFNVFSKI